MEENTVLLYILPQMEENLVHRGSISSIVESETEEVV